MRQKNKVCILGHSSDNYVASKRIAALILSSIFYSGMEKITQCSFG